MSGSSLSSKALCCARSVQRSSSTKQSLWLTITDYCLSSSTMPASMRGSNTTFIVQGDYNDHGYQYNIQGMGPGNYSLYLMCIGSELIYCMQIAVISSAKNIYVPPHSTSSRFTGQTYLANLRGFFELPTGDTPGRRRWDGRCRKDSSSEISRRECRPVSTREATGLLQGYSSARLRQILDILGGLFQHRNKRRIHQI